MKKRFIFVMTAILILAGIALYCLMLREDANGLTKNEIRQAKKALHAYISTQNAQEYDKSLALLSVIYSEQLDIMRKMLEGSSGIIYDDFQADYTEEICRNELDSVRRNELYDDFIVNHKVIYFTCSFTVLARQEGSELGSGFDADMRYEEYGYFLVKENGQWRILSWGY